MKITVVKPDELAADHRSAWWAFQEQEAALASPYFCLEFLENVAQVRNDVFVAIIENDNALAGFFPFQRSRAGVGTPVGGPLSDFHGLIADRKLDLPADELLKACKLCAYDFHHALADQPTFRDAQAETDRSHCIDLANGYDAYAAEIRAAGSELIKDAGRKRRKLEREHGPVRFVQHLPDVDVLRTLMSWKSAQYQRSGLVDVFSFGWTRELLERIHAAQTDDFGGMLSAMYVGDRLIATHFGMRSRRVWNWWFPRHDEEFSRYSPGILLRLFAAEAAPALGIRRIDLGQGDDATYKPRLANGGIMLAAGRAETQSVVNRLRRFRHDAEAWVRRSPLLPILKIPGRLLTRIERNRRFS